MLDTAALADWAAEADACLLLRIRAGDFLFPGNPVGRVVPAAAREVAQAQLDRALSLGDARSVEQDVEFAVRQLVEIGLRALSPGINDPFTAIAVLNRLGAALCELAGRRLPSGRHCRDGRLRLACGATDYAGLVDAMFHMLRQAGAGVPSVMIRLLEVLAEVAAVERDPSRLPCLRHHATLARAAALAGTTDAAGQSAISRRYRVAREAMLR